jgi:hypothetical protein
MSQKHPSKIIGPTMKGKEETLPHMTKKDDFPGPGKYFQNKPFLQTDNFNHQESNYLFIFFPLTKCTHFYRIFWSLR